MPEEVKGKKAKGKAAKRLSEPKSKRARTSGTSGVAMSVTYDRESGAPLSARPPVQPCTSHSRDSCAGVCDLVIQMPLDAPKLLVLELAEAAAAETFVRITPGIDKVFVLEGAHGAGPSIQVDGINFRAAWEQDAVVDINSIACNDVHAMLTVFGVEAARSTLVSEVRGVFGAYGIGVDYRHLALVADFMMQGGGYRACNRAGIESCTSPLLKMSFETSAHFLQDAALRGAADSMSSAAARIVMGQPVALGTGCVSLHMDLGAKASMPMLSY